MHIFSELLFKSFEDVDDPESKLDALGRKYLQLVRIFIILTKI